MIISSAPGHAARMRAVQIIVRGSVLAATVLAAQHAHAAPPEAQRLFNEGRALLREGRVEQAAVRFRESLAVVPTVGASLNLGDCEVRLGRFATAYRQFETAATLAERIDPERVSEARDRLKMLSPRVAFLVLRAAGGSPATLSVDGEALPEATTHWAVDGGSHVVAARCADGTSDRIVADVAVGATATRTICEPGRPRIEAATPPGAETKQPAQPTQPTPRTEARSSALTTVGWTSAGVGGAAVVTGIVLGAVALSKKSTASSDCPTYPRCGQADLPRAQSDYDAASGFASGSTVTLAVGAGLLAGGVLLLLLTRDQSPSVTSAFDRTRQTRVGSW